MAFTNLALTMYPVGSLYFSSLPESPAKLFGGKWTQLNDGKFLRPSNSFGHTGGSDTHTHHFDLYAELNSSHQYLYWNFKSSPSWKANWWFGSNLIDAGESTDANSYAITVDGKISGQSNVPAYRTVYCWYRVS